jgi:hypothetical protein
MWLVVLALKDGSAKLDSSHPRHEDAAVRCAELNESESKEFVYAYVELERRP